MALFPGTKFGPYEILLPLGAGGMGEVYRSRDTRLDRIVAIKTLPAHLSDNPEARDRFDREAQLGRAVHAVAAEIRPTTMAPSEMKSEVARSGFVIIK